MGLLLPSMRTMLLLKLRCSNCSFQTRKLIRSCPYCRTRLKKVQVSIFNLVMLLMLILAALVLVQEIYGYQWIDRGFQKFYRKLMDIYQNQGT
jgi:hypothetical protein